MKNNKIIVARIVLNIWFGANWIIQGPWTMDHGHPYKDQKSANIARKLLAELSRKINTDISPVYTSRKIKDEIKVREDKPPLVSQQAPEAKDAAGLATATGNVTFLSRRHCASTTRCPEESGVSRRDENLSTSCFCFFILSACFCAISCRTKPR